MGEQFAGHRICDMETDNVADPLLVVFAMEVAKMSLNFTCLSACNNLKTAELNFIVAPCFLIYEGHLESKERFAIKKYLLIIGKKKNMQVLSHTFTYFST